jgi:hypothetical protein
MQSVPTLFFRLGHPPTSFSGLWVRCLASCCDPPHCFHHIGQRSKSWKRIRPPRLTLTTCRCFNSTSLWQICQSTIFI